MAYPNIVDEHLLVVDISLELEAWDYVPTTPQPGQGNSYVEDGYVEDGYVE